MSVVAQTTASRALTMHHHQRTEAPMKTDTQLQTEVIAELAWEPSVHAAQIGVEVKDGVVTLAGHVGSFVEKWNAQRAALRVYGVKALAVEMDVKLSQLGMRTDADIAESAMNVLSWVACLPADAVQLTVEGGWLTLSGAVDWQYQKQAAADAVSSLVGVVGVSDQIALKPAVTSDAVKADIEAALQRRAKKDGNAISVDVRGAEVTLSGTVHSWGERDLATQAAWGAPGVMRVVDKMTVGY